MTIPIERTGITCAVPDGLTCLVAGAGEREEFFFGCEDGSVWKGDLVRNENICLLAGRSDRVAVRSLAALSDGKIACGDVQGIFTILDPIEGSHLRLSEDGKSLVCAIDLSDESGEKVAAGTEDGSIQVWHLLTLLCLSTLQRNESKNPLEQRSDEQKRVTVLARLPDSEEELVAGYGDGELWIWNARTRRHWILWEHNTTTDGSTVSKTGHTAAVTCLIKLSPEMMWASASEDKTIRIWDFKRERCLFTIQGHQAPVKHLLETSDGQLISGSEDGTMGIGNTIGRQFQLLHIHTVAVTALAEINHRTIAVGFDDGSIHVIDIDPEKPVRLRKFRDHQPEPVLSLIAPPGRLISASKSKMVFWKSVPHTPPEIPEKRESEEGQAEQ